ncbi:Putative TAFII28-like protein [Septoria linicola]|uniref:TAFII28-like protein n=1 Tax=Septoria linicola TaxID=215465 RepID=A0A9Q9EIW5_9PEZI|nr:putative TAFII28-like protein [Septoria linicola]USW51539.1 Putative TAFII28-like protein [Septoria linicola]
MASPPYSARSPPGPASAALPRPRPGGLSLALPSKSRKSSVAPASGHPLRQASFPPSDSLEAQHRAAEDNELRFSPGLDDDDLDEDDLDSEIQSAVSGPTDGGLKRKRGEKRPRGRPSTRGFGSRKGSVSVLGGEDGRKKGTRSTAGAPSVVTGGSQPDAEDSDDDHEDADGLGARGEAFTMDPAELDRDNQRRYLFREAVPKEHQERYDAYNKVKLRTADVRRLVNATLSQSVPQNVVTVVGAYTKMFAGMLIESARDVQGEWVASQPKRPDGQDEQAYKRLKLMTGREELEESEDDDDEELEKDGTNEAKDAGFGENDSAKPQSPPTKSEPKSPSSKVGADVPEADSSSSQLNGSLNGTQTTEAMSTPEKHKKKKKKKKKKKVVAEADELPDDFGSVQPGAWGLSRDVEECDRGPLQPDHLREALRRYKKSRSGGTVGFTGISLYGMENRDVAASRMGGRKLFR